MHSLAAIRRDLRDLQGAQELFEQTLADRRLVLGGDHPDTLASMNTVVELRRDSTSYSHKSTFVNPTVVPMHPPGRRLTPPGPPEHPGDTTPAGCTPWRRAA
jgi:Tetratricopeptide repeat